MTAQPTELHARLIDLFGSPATADPTKLYGNLTVNSSGQVVIGSSTQLVLPDGTQIATAAVGRNRVINGAMDVWQRSGSVTGTLSGYQTVDRFGCSTNSGSGHTAASSTDVPNGFASSWKLTVGTGASPAATHFNGIWHNIEGYNVSDFMYGTSSASYGVLTFWVKSSLTGAFAIGFMNNSLNRNYITTYTINTANTWQQITVIVPGDITGTWNNGSGTGLSICWDLGSGSNYQTGTNTWQAGQMYGTASSTKLIATSGASWQLTGVQFEKGQLARPFEKRLITHEIQMCRRYAWRINTNGSTVMAWSGLINGTTQIVAPVMFPVQMRANPTFSYSNISNSAWNVTNAVTSASIIDVSQDFCQLITGASGASYTTGQPGVVFVNNGGYVHFDSEL
jgi:hypothetical protein